MLAMNYIENISFTGVVSSFDNTENNLPFSVKEEDELFRARRRRDQVLLAAALPVNNYLKTPEEIETEFLCSLHTRKTDTGMSTPTMDGYTNIHELEKAFSGFMEENY